MKLLPTGAIYKRHSDMLDLSRGKDIRRDDETGVRGEPNSRVDIHVSRDENRKCWTRESHGKRKFIVS